MTKYASSRVPMYPEDKSRKERFDLHVAIAMEALGRRLPPKAEVHHVDGNGLNNSKENLVVCPDHAYHKLLHRRQAALDACGHADWMMCRRCKQYDDPSNMCVTSNHGHGVVAHHRECQNLYVRSRRLKLQSSF